MKNKKILFNICFLSCIFALIDAKTTTVTDKNSTTTSTINADSNSYSSSTSASTMNSTQSTDLFVNVPEGVKVQINNHTVTPEQKEQLRQSIKQAQSAIDQLPTKRYSMHDYFNYYDKEALAELCVTLGNEKQDLTEKNIRLRELLAAKSAAEWDQKNSFIFALLAVFKLHPIKTIIFLIPTVIASLAFLDSMYEQCKRMYTQLMQGKIKRIKRINSI